MIKNLIWLRDADKTPTNEVHLLCTNREDILETCCYLSSVYKTQRCKERREKGGEGVGVVGGVRGVFNRHL